MIRPQSEIEYPPSEALCMKARMIRRMEALSSSSDGLMSVIAQRIDIDQADFKSEIDAMSDEQTRLVANMKRIVGA